jgi:hypothetical protein
MTFFRKIARQPATFPIFVLLVLIAAYGYQIHRMGFYWDDWQLVYLASLKTPQVFWGFYAFDRPLAAWLYVLLSPVLGINPVAWQVFAILARWIGCLGFWKLFRQIWPDRYLEAGFAALLLAVYPEFTQQPISITYSLFWVLYALFIWSLTASVSALRQPKNYISFTILAVLASLMETLSMEYVIGLELLRPVLFTIVLLQLGKTRIQAVKRAFTQWIPYFLVLCVFVYFRFIYFPQIHTDPEANAPILLHEILTSPLTAVPHLLQNMLQDLSQALVFAWGKPIIPTEIDFSQMTNWFALIIGVGVTAVAIYLLLHKKTTTESTATAQEEKIIPFQMILIGFASVILGGLPVWSTNRQIIVGMWSDRFSLSLMFGAVILMVGATAWLMQKPIQKAVFLSIFLALGLAFQVQNTARYKLNWDAQKDYYWQLIWRAPQFKPGTVVLGNKVPFGLSAEYSVGFALNSIYSPQSTETLPYWFFSAVSDRGGAIPEYVDGVPLKFSLRTIQFESNTSNGVAVFYKYGQSCLRVMTKEDTRFPNLDDSESELLAISHPEQIVDTGKQTTLPAVLFGKEPTHNWCYYFQKADLARQNEDWQNVLAIYNQAKEMGFSPKNGTELMPMILANSNLNHWQEAMDLTQQGLALTGGAKPYFCSYWELFKSIPSGDPPASEMLQQLNCQ